MLVGVDARKVCSCLKKNLNASRPSEHPPVMSKRLLYRWDHRLQMLFLAFSVLAANLKKLFYIVANPARGLLNREKRTK